jgi:uncharacterized protein with ATP-grasp and redox domains
MILQLGAAMAEARGQDRTEAARRGEACKTEFFARFDAFLADPRGFGRVTILTLDQWRDPILRKHGFGQAFSDLKERENAGALRLLAKVCAELDGLAGHEQLRAVVLGVLAGNIFDMGAEAVAHTFLGPGGAHGFFETRDKIVPRPWRIDDYDALAGRLLNGPPHRKAVYFVDNAGADFILGAIPFMRWLGRRGTRVVLAANERPTLNDMTIHEVNDWWPKLTAAEPSLADLPIERVSTGTGEALIDLSDVSAELNAAAADADLVILEGMGRGIESNLEARFSCDALKLAMIKDEAVAARHGGKLFDVVCRWNS